MIISSNQTATKLDVNLKKRRNSKLKSRGIFDLSIIPQVIFNRIEKRIANGNTITILMKNKKQDGSSFWSLNTFSPLNDQSEKHLFSSEITYDFGLINRVENLYKIITKIEKYKSVQIAEKYLVGYLEERNKTLSQLSAA